MNKQPHGLHQVLAVAVGALLLTLLTGCEDRPDPIPGKFAQNMYRYQIDVDGDAPWYLIYTPDDYDPATPTPLIMYWHGLFQGGRDGFAPYTERFAFAFRDHPELYPCIIAMPQLPFGTSVEEGEAIHNAVLEKMKADFNIDSNRIYVCGSSFGGKRAMEYVAHTPDIFAALFDIAGPIDVSFAPMLTDIPIFMAHGDADLAVPVTQSRELVDAIQEAGGSVEYVEFPGERHEIYYGVYSNPEFLDWLFSQQLNP